MMSVSSPDAHYEEDSKAADFRLAQHCQSSAAVLVLSSTRPVRKETSQPQSRASLPPSSPPVTPPSDSFSMDDLRYSVDFLVEPAGDLPGAMFVMIVNIYCSSGSCYEC